MRHLAVTLASVVALSSMACEPLPEEDPAPSLPGPSTFLDRSSDPNWGPGGQAPTLPDGYEVSDSSLTLDSNLKDQLPAEISVLLERASEIGGLISQAKTAQTLVSTWLHLFDYVEKQPPLSAQITALHRAINEVANLWVEMHRKDLHDEVEEVFTIALRRAREAVRTGTTLSSDWGTEAAILKAARDSSFERMYRTLEEPPWYHSLVPADELVNGKIWDWRLGLPVLMLHTNLRLSVMAAQDRNFNTNPAFASELKDLRAAVYRAFDRMVSGIRCDWRWAQGGNIIESASVPVHVLTSSPYPLVGLKPLLIACIDIHSGMALQERARGLNDANTLAGIETLKKRMAAKLQQIMPIDEVIELLTQFYHLQP